MEVFGYKCFNKDLINIYGQKFEVGKEYFTVGDIKFGPSGNGFHLCENLEDTFRFFDTTTKDICVCEVIGSGDIIKSTDEYNGYYNMYCCRNLKIVKQLSREDVIKQGLQMHPERVKRFISTLTLTKEEIELFKIKFYNSIEVINAIAYYQENDKDVYYRKLNKTR